MTEKRLAESANIDALCTEDVLRIINEQDALISAVIAAAVPVIARVVDDVAERVGRGGRLIYCGAGTSGRLGVLDASEMPPTFHTDPSMVVGIISGGDSALRKSSEHKEDNAGGPCDEFDDLNVNENDSVIGVAAGGTTPWVWGALRLANQRGAMSCLMCCVDAASIDRPERVDHMIELPVGPEVVTGSTRMKAGTVTKLALNMISTTVMIKLGKTWGNLMVDLSARCDKLVDRAARIVSTQCDVSRDEAIAILDRADGRVKVALVMAKRGVERDEAQRLLTEHDQQLRPIVGNPI